MPSSETPKKNCLEPRVRCAQHCSLKGDQDLGGAQVSSPRLDFLWMTDVKSETPKRIRFCNCPYNSLPTLLQLVLCRKMD